MNRMARIAVLALALGASAGAALACPAAPAPVIVLEVGSRYLADDPSRSVKDAEADIEVTRALRPVDDFVRGLVREANSALRAPETAAAPAACVVAHLDAWAQAGALADLRTFGAGLSIGARIAGMAEAYRQVQGFSRPTAAHHRIERWLQKLAEAQIDFWEMSATFGAREGNLRAWAALGVHDVGAVTGRDDLRMWGLASAARILCTTTQEGALPQEMRRGTLALHYQFHAIAPLAVLAARSGGLAGLCDDALARAVRFALQDHRAGGVRAQALSGQAQPFAQQPVPPHMLGWIPAWLSLRADPLAADIAAEQDWLAHSFLGGDARLLWPAD